MLFGSRLNKLAAAIKRAIESLSGYAVASKEPDLVFDFASDYYRTSGSDSTFADSITHARASNATMVDSDGVLKWGPHNLLTYSEDFSNAAWFTINATLSGNTLTSTANGGKVQQGVSVPAHSTLIIYVVKGTASNVIIDTGSAGFHDQTPFNLNDLTYELRLNNSAASIEDIGGGILKLSVTRGSTAGTRISLALAVSGETVTLSPNWHLYRSDLGGMVDNPARGDSYVPTTDSARYLPRVGHHLYNGNAWVNEGLLHESEARTNLVTYSEDFTDASWSKSNTATLAVDATGPDGETSAVTLVDSGATGSGTVYVGENVTVSTSTVYSASIFAKADQLDRILLYAAGFTTPANNGYVFNLTAGTYTAYAGTPAMTPNIQDFGNGWYRCSITFTTDAADTAGIIRFYVMNADGVGGEAVDLDGTSSILIYGAQFEAAPTPSSYIPTSGSTVTRAADTLTVPSANLPWPEPVVIGPELVTNGTFDTDSDWTLNGTATISSGTGKNLTGGDYIAQSFTTEAGKYYQLTFDALPGSNTGNSLVRIGTSANSFSIQSTSLGTIGTGLIRRFVATGATTWVTFYQASFTAEYDNISVREIDPLSVSIQMDGAMTYADDNSSNNVIPFSWAATSSGAFPSDANYIFPFLRTDTGTGRFDFRQRADGTVSAVSTDNSVYSPGTNVPYNIASRHGSTFINGAVDGTALTANTTPVALPDLSATDLNLGYVYMGTIKTFRVWDEDLADEGIEEATAPSLEPSLSLIFDSTESSFIVEDWT